MDARARRASHRVALLRVGICAAFALALGAGAAAAAPAATPEGIDRSLLELRIALAAAGLALFAAGVRLRGRGAAEASTSVRRVLLGVVALASVAANYNLFVWTGLHRHELYHYYLGSKYFPELGYFDLYRCSVEAVAGAGPLPAALEEITDLHKKQRRPAAEVMAASAAQPCATAFAPERWAAFRGDVEGFRAWMGERTWIGVLRDHGYNPSPAWTLFGRTLASLVPPTPSGLWLLARLDLLLLAAAFAVLAWAFGGEAACLAAIAWGTCGHTRYQWTGDAMLRQLWLAASLAGVALLRKGRVAAAGALLALATLERVFPGAFLLGFGARELAYWLRERRATAELWRFMAGAAVASALVVASATAVAGRGPAVWIEFAENTRAMLSFTPRNALGLDYALSFTRVPPPGGLGSSPAEREEIVQAYRETTLAARTPWRIAGLSLFVVAFALAAWRGAARGGDGAPRLLAWEATALGAAAIPFLTMPGSYYLGFVLVGAPLAVQRPRIGVALLVACMVWSASLVVWEARALAFAASSWVLLAYSLWLLGEIAFAAPARALSDG
jgi:hypothetical protein